MAFTALFAGHRVAGAAPVEHSRYAKLDVYLATERRTVRAPPRRRLKTSMKARILKRFEDEMAELDRELKTRAARRRSSARASWATCARTPSTRPRRSASLRPGAHQHAAEAGGRDLADQPRPASHDRAAFGSTVELLEDNGDGTMVYQLVMPEDADATKGLISTTSPIGRAIVGKEAATRSTVPTPNGERRFEIVKLITIHDECLMAGARSPTLHDDRTALVLTAPARPAPTTPACCARCTKPASASTSSPAAASAPSARCSRRSTAGPRLWEPDGLWRQRAVARLLRLAADRCARSGGSAPPRCCSCSPPLVPAGVGLVVYPTAFLLRAVHVAAGTCARRRLRRARPRRVPAGAPADVAAAAGAAARGRRAARWWPPRRVARRLPRAAA